PPTVRSPTRRSRPCAGRSSPPWPSSSEAGCVASPRAAVTRPSVAVLGAAGYAGAIAAQLLYRHPFFELRHVTARAEAGQRLDDVHPRTRVPLELQSYDPDVGVDAAVVAYPHGAAAPVVGDLRD